MRAAILSIHFTLGIANDLAAPTAGMARWPAQAYKVVMPKLVERPRREGRPQRSFKIRHLANAQLERLRRHATERGLDRDELIQRIVTTALADDLVNTLLHDDRPADVKA